MTAEGSHAVRGAILLALLVLLAPLALFVPPRAGAALRGLR